MNYDIIMMRTALKDLESAPNHIVKRAVSKIDNLSTNPRPAGSKKLKGLSGKLRLRIGDWRILYSVNEVDHKVVIHRVAPRSEAYEN